jgi:hypothetical protein
MRNWHIQAAGGDMLRLAVIAMSAAGISVVAPVHDAVLIEADADVIEDHVEVAKALMVEASSVTTGGFPLRVDAKDFRGWKPLLRQAGDRDVEPCRQDDKKYVRFYDCSSWGRWHGRPDPSWRGNSTGRSIAR